MQRSVARILTTHVGSLPFLSLDRGVAAGDQTHLDEDVAAIVARQRDIGIDIINEGEYAKGAVVVFAVFSYLTSTSTSLNQLLAYRFCCGLGLGGVTPAFLAMGAELAPKRLRDVFVTVLFASFPGGGLIGSLTSAWVIPTFGWQSVFYIGAVA